ncbi:Uu.00g042140.m01.CDS01 [Anthostomella pinea]|uniref:Uu.00g042140.m01.CDS01 n=1 Tax=Anthostomella pinea TaxID=933095 RepID=A0AAI8YE04_9PEZI|nr:Uu.00g042140.m01.CDS01 [Anthostomella pinea]
MADFAVPRYGGCHVLQHNRTGLSTELHNLTARLHSVQALEKHEPIRVYGLNTRIKILEARNKFDASVIHDLAHSCNTCSEDATSQTFIIDQLIKDMKANITQMEVLRLKILRRCDEIERLKSHIKVVTDLSDTVKIVAPEAADLSWGMDTSSGQVVLTVKRNLEEKLTEGLQNLHGTTREPLITKESSLRYIPLGLRPPPVVPPESRQTHRSGTDEASEAPETPNEDDQRQSRLSSRRTPAPYINSILPNFIRPGLLDPSPSSSPDCAGLFGLPSPSASSHGTGLFPHAAPAIDLDLGESGITQPSSPFLSPGLINPDEAVPSSVPTVPSYHDPKDRIFESEEERHAAITDHRRLMGQYAPIPRMFQHGVRFCPLTTEGAIPAEMRDSNYECRNVLIYNIHPHTHVRDILARVRGGQVLRAVVTGSAACVTFRDYLDARAYSEYAQAHIAEVFNEKIQEFLDSLKIWYKKPEDHLEDVWFGEDGNALHGTTLYLSFRDVAYAGCMYNTIRNSIRYIGMQKHVYFAADPCVVPLDQLHGPASLARGKQVSLLDAWQARNCVPEPAPQLERAVAYAVAPTASTETAEWVVADPMTPSPSNPSKETSEEPSLIVFTPVLSAKTNPDHEEGAPLLLPGGKPGGAFGGQLENIKALELLLPKPFAAAPVDSPRGCDRGVRPDPPAGHARREPQARGRWPEDHKCDICLRSGDLSCARYRIISQEQFYAQYDYQGYTSNPAEWKCNFHQLPKMEVNDAKDEDTEVFLDQKPANTTEEPGASSTPRTPDGSPKQQAKTAATVTVDSSAEPKESKGEEADDEMIPKWKLPQNDPAYRELINRDGRPYVFAWEVTAIVSKPGPAVYSMSEAEDRYAGMFARYQQERAWARGEECEPELEEEDRPVGGPSLDGPADARDETKCTGGNPKEAADSTTDTKAVAADPSRLVFKEAKSLSSAVAKKTTPNPVIDDDEDIYN